ncbi:MAG: S8 family serine peptidase [Nitriliruptoraceae bacterium]
MSGTPLRPAWARESAVLKLPGAPTLEDLSPEWAWGGATGRGVRVAVIDSGIEADHPALQGCVDGSASAEFLDQDGEVVVRRGPHADGFGHGTACAAIIHSFAPEARVTSLKVLDGRLRSTGAVFHRALEWAVDEGFDVVNLSLGTVKRDWALPFYELCDRAYFAGTLLVTAANNVARPSFPSLFASVTSVACNLSDDPWRFHHNPEPPTEFLARGIDVEVAWRGGSTSRVTGNSYAAPHIAGLAARILSKHPGLTPFQLKTVLWSTSANVLEAGELPGRLGRRMTAMGRMTVSSRHTSTLRRPTPTRSR